MAITWPYWRSSAYLLSARNCQSFSYICMGRQVAERIADGSLPLFAAFLFGVHHFLLLWPLNGNLMARVFSMFMVSKCRPLVHSVISFKYDLAIIGKSSRLRETCCARNDLECNLTRVDRPPRNESQGFETRA